MQYILSQEEYDDLVYQSKKAKSLPSKGELQKFCTLVADTLPIDWCGRIEPWKCILSVDYRWYCDACPSKEICPCDRKNYSK